jgi:hypothetical protein
MAQLHQACTGDSTPEITRRLQQIPNVGPAIAVDLLRLGITRVEDLAGRDPAALYEQLCALDGARHDPCVLDTFTAAVAFANGEPAQPWWIYSRRRKEREQRRMPQPVSAHREDRHRSLDHHRQEHDHDRA